MRFLQRAPRKPNIEISPLVDVVFLLIIFFAVSTTFREGAGLPVELPSAGSAVMQNAGPVEITIGSEGRIEVGGKIFPTLEAATEAISVALDASSTRSILLRGDRKAYYEIIVKVLDLARRLEVKGISLATRKGSAAEEVPPS
ncbi:MAG: biopolymer transporter ExbD [Acidobacteriota bacterium]|nr:biopolymer transporter ExbD [Acidobacteriota bacterium]